MRQILFLYIPVLFMILISENLQANFSETDSLEILIKKHPEPDTIRINLLIKAAYELRKTDLEKSLLYAKEADSISVTLDYNKGIANSLRIIGLYYYYKSDFKLALQQYNRSIAISEKYGFDRVRAKCYNNIGNVYRKQGDYLAALEYFQKSLMLSEKNDDKFVIASALGNIGLIYWRRNDYEQALEYYKKSLEKFELLDYKKGISNSLNNIGILYYYQNNYDKSLEYFHKSLDLDKSLHDTTGIASSFNNIAEIYGYQGNYPKSLEYFKKSLQMREHLGDKVGVCSSYYGIGGVYFKMKNYPSALKFSQKGLKIANELALLDKQKELYKQLSDIYAGMQKYDKAYECHVLYKELNDSLFNEKNIKKIADLEYRYKKEKEEQAAKIIQQKKDVLFQEEMKRQKILRNSFIIGFVFALIFLIFILNSFFQKRRANYILAKQKAKIQEKNNQLRQLNVTQSKLMSIISHDFKAPLSAFYSITNSLKTKFDKISRPEIERYLGRMLNSSIALKLQLENMLNWSMGQSSRIYVNKSKVNLFVLSSKVIIILQEFANEKSISIENNIAEDIEIETDVKLLSIVLNNLIVNAIKFSPAGSVVLLSAYYQDDSVVVSVKDEGAGMDKTELEHLFSDAGKGTKAESGTGLGLTVSKEITEKLGGEIWAESKGEGSEFFIKL